MSQAALAQAVLSAEQIQEFYHDAFVGDQVRDFRVLLGDRSVGIVLDVGGGCGFFARSLSHEGGYQTRVMDMDPTSIENCRTIGVDGRIGDALAPNPVGDEEVVCFNLILHHLVGKTENETRELQIRALRAWRGKAARLFVNEYIYQSLVGQISGRLIYEITSSEFLSSIGRQIARVIPSFKANTFGVGVRFRSREQWMDLFSEAGFCVENSSVGSPEYVSPPLRGLMIKTIRRDSFLLKAA